MYYVYIFLNFLGDKITPAKAMQREKEYDKEGKGCYIYFNVTDIYGRLVR